MLVEYEEVGLPHQHRGKVQTATLASAKRVDILLLVGHGKQKALQILHRRYAAALSKLDVVGNLCILEEYLAEFKGCVLVVSHDRYFLDNIADHIFVMEGGSHSFSDSSSQRSSFSSISSLTSL